VRRKKKETFSFFGRGRKKGMAKEKGVD